MSYVLTQQRTYEMTGAATPGRRTLLLAALLALAVSSLAACDGGQSLVSLETPSPIDPATLPGDSTPILPIPDPLVPLPPGSDSAAPPPAPGPDSVTPPPDSTGPAVPPAPPPEHVGLAFGPLHLPAGEFGPNNSATLRTARPIDLLLYLEAARWADTRVIVSFVGSGWRYRDDKKHFSLAKWKARVDRFRGIDFSSYIQDGTIIGHYIMDEPHDRSNWGGTVVSRAQVDEMARYSKEIWPSMLTIIRGWPDFLKGHQYQYLDAAWAQYSDRFGDVDAFISNNVRDARAAGLALVVGLNLVGGGNKSGGLKGFSGSRYAMTASQVRRAGGALLAEPYICAFMNWKYVERYFSRTDIKVALEELNQKARSRPLKSCAK